MRYSSESELSRTSEREKRTIERIRRWLRRTSSADKMDESGGSGGHDTEEQATISVTVKFGGRSIPMAISPESTIKELKSLLQPLTNVLPRGQKLISKGKVLADSMTLRASDVKNGAKIMLMASQGLHQGDGPILKEASTRPIVRRNNNVGNTENQKTALIDKTRLGRWKATGSLGLADSSLKVIPDEVWAVGSSVKILDISNNSIQDVPSKIGELTSLQKLLLNANELADDSISWEVLASLKHLTLLSMNHNHLTVLPSVLGSLSSLRQLDISFNKLTSLPEEIGHLSQLEVLKANNNRISSIPTSIGNCRSLIEINLSYNLLAELPESISNLHSLKILYLSNNGLKSVPYGLFKTCIHLSTLDLYNTEITTDTLRQFEGWEEFEERRRSKHQKQLDFRVVGPGSAQFDEGADKK